MAVTPRLIWEPVLVEQVLEPVLVEEVLNAPMSALVLKPLVLELLTIVEPTVYGLLPIHYVPVSPLVLKPLVLQLMTILEKRVHGLLLFVLNGSWLPHLATLALIVRTGGPKPPAMAAVRGCGRLKRARVPQCLCTLRRPAR